MLTTPPSIVLYQWPSSTEDDAQAQLPSATAACLQVEVSVLCRFGCPTPTLDADPVAKPPRFVLFTDSLPLKRPPPQDNDHPSPLTQAYLRFADARFAVQPCPTASASPIGVLPAVERAGELNDGGPAAGGGGAGGGGGSHANPLVPAPLSSTTRYVAPPPGPHEPASGSDLAAARLAIDFLRQPGSAAAAAAAVARGGREGAAAAAATAPVDLDAPLSPAQRADAAALCALITSRLDPATLATTWIEPGGYAALRAAVYAPALPWPLSRAVPWQERQRQLARLRGLDPAAAYEAAVGALAVLDERLSSGPGPYLLGARPCTADALLFGHAAFWRRSPVAAPVLRAAVAALPALDAFVSRTLAGPFRRALSPAFGDDDDEEGDQGEEGGRAAGRGAAADAPGWSRAARGKPARAPPPKPPLTEEELSMRRGSALWLGGAAAALGAYAVTSGQFFEVVEVEDGGDDDDDAADDDDD